LAKARIDSWNADAPARLPVTALVDAFYPEVEKMGGSRWHTSGLVARLER
jgi:3-hydroxyisobutyrate dehydrogenase